MPLMSRGRQKTSMIVKGQLSSILGLGTMNEGAGALLLLLDDIRVTIGGGFTNTARIETACHY